MCVVVGVNTVPQRPAVCGDAYGTVRYKEPYKLFDKSDKSQDVRLFADAILTCLKLHKALWNASIPKCYLPMQFDRFILHREKL